MKTIGVVGSRRRAGDDSYRLVSAAVRRIFEDGDHIVSGGCHTGADAFAERIARQIGAPIIIHHANWKALGRMAGFARNALIARDADVIVACVAADRTGGTEDTIRKFVKGKGTTEADCIAMGSLILV